MNHSLLLVIGAVATASITLLLFWFNTVVYLLLPISSAQGNITFNPSISLSKGLSGIQSNPQMTISGNNVYVVWESSITKNNTMARVGQNKILFTQSTNNGLDFNSALESGSSSANSNIMSLKEDIGYSKIPRKIGIAASDKYVYIVWRDYSSDNNGSVLFRESGDRGVSFKQTLVLDSNNPGSFLYDQDPKLAEFGNNVYVVWESHTYGSNHIYFKASKDNGESFGKTIDLSNIKGDSVAPEVSAYGNNVYVVWLDKTSFGNCQTIISKSKDNGTSFERPIRLSNNAVKAESPEVSAYGNTVYVSWSQGKGQRISNAPINRSVMASQNRSINNPEDIFFTKSKDNGTSFERPIRLSNNTGHSYMQKIAVGPESINSNRNNKKINRVYVVWSSTSSTNQSENNQIFIRASKDNGESFGNIINLSNDTTAKGHSSQYQLSAFENNVYVVWTRIDSNNFNTNTRHSQILLKESRNNGTTFEPVISLDNATDGMLSSPRITIASESTGYLYAIWVYNKFNEGEVRFSLGIG